MAKITAIHAGGDWYDACAYYLVLPEGLNAEALYDKWIEFLRTSNGVISFEEWAVEHQGARYPTAEEFELVDRT
jgi:hypothetical protein